MEGEMSQENEKSNKPKAGDILWKDTIMTYLYMLVSPLGFLKQNTDKIFEILVDMIAITFQKISQTFLRDFFSVQSTINLIYYVHAMGSRHDFLRQGFDSFYFKSYHLFYYLMPGGTQLVFYLFLSLLYKTWLSFVY